MVDNDYTPAAQSTDGWTPTTDMVIQAFIDSALRQCRVWMPATVLTVTPGGTTQVSVQPQLLRTFTNSPTPVKLPPLQNVPVFYPRGANYGVKLPVAVGDSGIVLFCDQSLDIWKAQTEPGYVWPQSTRAHDLSDGCFIPGAYPLLSPPATQTAAAGPLDMVLYNGLAQLLLQPGGTFIQGNGPLNVFQLLAETLTELVATVTDIAGSFTALATAGTTDGTIPTTTAAFTVAAGALVPFITALTALEAGFTALAGEPGE